MDEIANLVIHLGIDADKFKNEIPRIKNLLNGAASDAERSSARMQRFMERQTRRPGRQCRRLRLQQQHQPMRDGGEECTAHERMAREVEQTRLRVDALNQKMREGTGAGRAWRLSWG